MKFLQISMILISLSVSLGLPYQSDQMFSVIKRQRIPTTNELELDDPLLFQKMFYRPQIPQDSSEGFQRFYALVVLARLVVVTSFWITAKRLVRLTPRHVTD
ncbi:hypothetical protein EWB00_002878 [Schistosoma japonicum]|uniref:Uncharacterized protein n=1 Tax=Schistosoma japonicum TaxID=6182 RepID=A0A4Z2DW93_SCHJA|nr:hypothetical protein EWB00_002878 [Schistosoma japonicum]